MGNVIRVRVVDVLKDQVGGRTGLSVGVKGLEVIVSVRSLDKGDILVESKLDLGAGEESKDDEANRDSHNGDLGQDVEESRHVVLLEIFSYDLFSRRSDIFTLNATADDIRAVFLYSFSVKGEDTNEDGQLKEEVCQNTESSHEAEVL